MTTRAPWVTHFGFSKTRFGKTIPANKLCERASHQEAVARIRFCVAESLLGVITGEVGVGKTVAVRAATSQLDQAAQHIVYLANPAVGTRGLYVSNVRALGAMPRGFKAELIAQTQNLLAAEEHERRRRVVLIVDEAHLLTPEQPEKLRLLPNTDMDVQSPLALLLVGQPTLARQLRMGVFAALDQRIATRCQIGPMDLGEAGRLPAPPPGPGRPRRTALRRGCHRSFAQSQPRPAARLQQRRHRRADRRGHGQQGVGRR